MTKGRRIKVQRKDMTSDHTTDYYSCDDLFTPEEIEIRNKVRSWVQNQYLPKVADYFEHGVFPLEIIPELAFLKLLGIKQTEFGCPGMSNMAYGLICQELERGDSGLRSFVSVINALVMYPIAQFGSETQKSKWLPVIANGEKIGCFGLTEPDAGSDPNSMKTTAYLAQDHYVLNGRKMWITNGEIADVAIIWARTKDGIRGFLVERGTTGFSAHAITRKFSLRTSVTSALVLKDVHIPAENLLPGTAGLKSALMCLNEARYGIAWGAVGAALACYEAALEYAGKREQFGAPISSYQLVQQKLVKMLTEITKAQLLCVRLGQLKDQGIANHTHISMAKMNNAAEALEIARTARDIMGANGITLGHHVIRHMLNLETVNTYEGTHDIHTLVLGRDITGYGAFSR